MNRSILKKLELWKTSSNRKPLILKGARQVGKTWALKEFGRTSFNKTYYINFEEHTGLHALFEKDLDPQRILRELSFHFDHDIDPAADLLIFDEIQKCPRALTSLKYFYEDLPRLAVCAAGSLLGIFHGDASFPVGKVTFLELRPLNFREYVESAGKTAYTALLDRLSLPGPVAVPETAHTGLWEMWKEYMVVGGMPEAVRTMRTEPGGTIEKLKRIRGLQHDLINVYTADIAKNSGRMKSLNIERLWRDVPRQLARTAEGTAPKFRFKDAVPGLRGYDKLAGPLDWLEKAGLVIRSSIVKTPGIPLSASGSENKFKLYFFDSGLLGAMSGIPPKDVLSMDFGSYKGYLAENFVAQELIAHGTEKLYCWTGRNSEIEFLLETAYGITPVEVKSGYVTRSKSLNVYNDKYGPERSFVISAANRTSPADSRTQRIPLYLAGLLSAPRPERRAPSHGDHSQGDTQ